MAGAATVVHANGRRLRTGSPCQQEGNLQPLPGRRRPVDGNEDAPRSGVRPGQCLAAHQGKGNGSLEGSQGLHEAVFSGVLVD